MSTQLDALHQRLAKLEAWKEKIGADLGSGVARMHAVMGEVTKLLEGAKVGLDELGIKVPGVNAPVQQTPQTPADGEPKP